MWSKGTVLATIVMAVALTGVDRPAMAENMLLDEITVRGVQQPQTEENLTIREVRESPARDMGEALQAVPGLSIVRKGAIANDVVVRGLQGDDINVFLDGVRIHGGCPSRMDPPSFHFDFAEVDAIEVIKGPYDVENPGSLGGTVNAVSRQPDKGPGLSASLTYGTADLVNASLKGSYGGEQFDALAGYAYKYSLPPRSGDGKRITAIYPAISPNRYRDDDVDSRAYSIDTFWVKGGYRITDKARTELSYSYQDADHVLYPYLLMDADYDRTDRVNWTTTVDDLGPILKQLSFQAWWNEVEHLMHDGYRVSSLPTAVIRRDYSMQTDATTETYGAKLKGSWAVGPGTLDTGVDYYLRNWDAVNEIAMYTMAAPYTPQPMIPDVDVDNIGVFAAYSVPLGDAWSIKAGVRLDHTTAEAGKLDAARMAKAFQPYYPGQDLDDDTDFTEVSGNVQMTWKAADSLEFFAGFGSGSRPPDAQELYINLLRPGTNPNWLGNPKLSPTRNNQADLGARLTGEDWFTKLSLFYSDLQDYIDIAGLPAPAGGKLARGYRNVDATLWGGELSGQVALPGDFYLSGALSYVHGENDDTDEPLAEMPPLTGNIGVRYDVDRWFVELTERFADDQDRVDDNLEETETAGWGVTDLKAGLNWERWTVTAGVNNVFDKYYFTHLSYQRDPFRSGYRVPETGAFTYLTVAYRY
ncbi:MAG: TonB-dependent receptor [Desulfuromonadales bacterium]|nr:TonB-dependent receptor [Desulfuromonadales bacterium]